MNNLGQSPFNLVTSIPDPQTAVNTAAITKNTTNIATNTTNITTSTTDITRLNAEIERVREKTGTIEAMHLTTVGGSSFKSNDFVVQDGSVGNLWEYGCGNDPARNINPANRFTTTTSPINNAPDFKTLLTFEAIPYALSTTISNPVTNVYSLTLEFAVDLKLTNGGLPNTNPNTQSLAFQTYIQLNGLNPVGAKLFDLKVFTLTATITTESQPQVRRHKQTFTITLPAGVAILEIIPKYSNTSTKVVTDFPRMVVYASSDDVYKCFLKATLRRLTPSP